MGAQCFHKSRSRLKILGAKRVTWNKFHIEKSQILGTIIQTWVAIRTCTPGLGCPSPADHVGVTKSKGKKWVAHNGFASFCTLQLQTVLFKSMKWGTVFVVTFIFRQTSVTKILDTVHCLRLNNCCVSARTYRLNPYLWSHDTFWL